MKKHAKRKINKQYLLIKTHRYIGLASFIILCWLAVSGLLLNHTEALKLSHKVTTNRFLLSLYNVPEPVFTQGAKSNDQWVFAIDHTLYLDRLKLSTIDHSSFIAALSKDDLLVIATEKKLLLFTEKGELVDRLTSTDTIKAIGLNTKADIVVDTDKGCLVVNDDMTLFSACSTREEGAINWVTLSDIPDTLKADLRSQNGGISLERVFLDAHSGRILGIAGVYFMDVMAILIIIIGLSGFAIWLVRKMITARRKKARRL
ncbi:MAG: hypothetical protein HAW67_00405 [Endozoicomonadaceae bacterium]|nr:hypothetical protein [Endozoicomonadaceae bacterium]